MPALAIISRNEEGAKTPIVLSCFEEGRQQIDALIKFYSPTRF